MIHRGKRYYWEQRKKYERTRMEDTILTAVAKEETKKTAMKH